MGGAARSLDFFLKNFLENGMITEGKIKKIKKEELSCE